MVYVVFLSPWEHSQVIEVYHHALSNETAKGDIDGALKCCACIYNPKWHSYIRKRTPLGTLCSFESARFWYQNLIVSWETVKKRKHMFPRYYLKNMVHRQHRVVVFVWGAVYVLEHTSRFPWTYYVQEQGWRSMWNDKLCIWSMHPTTL